ncbi:MAG: SH3 domain-containing protein [Anaerolineaceae bacterium]|nr:SH3 domain-containing protein [Anaerolineaceae bacterium]
MTLPASEPIPDDTDHLPPARRRRERRHLAPLGLGERNERAAFLDSLAARAIPSFDFFLFSLISGLVFGLGFLLNAPAVSVVAAVLAPFLAPLLGLSLATVIGSGRFFLKSLISSVLGVGLAFLGGFLAGFAPRYLPSLPLPLTWGVSQTQFSWPSLAALSLLVVLTVTGYVRSQSKAFLPEVGMAYLLYLPLAAAGFGLSAGAGELWPHGLIVFSVHLAWTVVLGALILAALGLRPLTVFGYSLGATIGLSGLVVLLALSGIGTILRRQETIPIVVPTQQTPTATLVTATATPTEAVPTATPTPRVTPSNTLVPSATFTETITPAPTPVWAIINAASLNGAYIRAEPKVGSKILTSVLNGALVKVLPETIQDGGTIWAHILTTGGLQGWIVQSLLVTATPAPGW